MSNYVRKLVSGGKARFKDKELDLDLDLVYVTDQIIIMGWPAGGFEGFYRNRREDAKKFLDYRHPDNYWIFNLCPLSENSYDAAVFGGRVSRYPFPDHYAPPLALLPLATREIRLWLHDSPERVAVLHCKAGKGRSGTLACAYLLSLDISPEPPRLQRSYTTKQWAKLRAEEWMDVVEMNDMLKTKNSSDTVTSGQNITVSSSDVSYTTQALLTQETATKLHGTALEKVLTLHTTRRMKAASSSSLAPSRSKVKKQRQGLLSNAIPAHFWPLDTTPAHVPQNVKLMRIAVRLREDKGTAMTVIKAINVVLDKTAQRRSYPYGKNDSTRRQCILWASLARYDDNFVDVLEYWERRTRGEQGHFVKRRVSTDEDEGVYHIFDDGKWDRGKMVQSFARLGCIGEEVGVREDEEGRIRTHVLGPLGGSQWTIIQKAITEDPQSVLEGPQSMTSKDEEPSLDNIVQKQDEIKEGGIVLDATRDVRVKLYLGQVFIGWFWFIPAFHMSNDPTTHLCLKQQDVDFPLGAGTWIVDVDIEMEWVFAKDA